MITRLLILSCFLAGCHSQTKTDSALDKAEIQLKQNEQTLEESRHSLHEAMTIHCTIKESQDVTNLCHNR